MFDLPLEVLSARGSPGLHDTNANLDDLDQLLKPINPGDEFLDRLGQGAEKLARVRLAESRLAGVRDLHHTATRQHPFAADAEGLAQSLEKLDTRGLPAQIAAHRLLVHAGQF